MPRMLRTVPRALRHIAGALTLLALGALWRPADAQMQERDLSDDSGEGMNAVRVESEYKL